jgi:RNA polymerase sigma factor (sigma-70 family)
VGVDSEDEARRALEEGDHKAALTALMRGYGDGIHRHCRSMLGPGPLADEAHQAVFVQAWRDLPRFEGRSTFRTWLFGISRHRCLDAARAYRRRNRRFLQASGPEASDDRPDAEAELSAAQATAHAKGPLDACLDALAAEARFAVLLRYQEGMRYTEIARVCRARPGTVQARVTRGLETLRRCLQSKGVSGL